MKLGDGNGIELQIFASSSFGDMELCCVMRIMMQWNSAVEFSKALGVMAKLGVAWYT